ncbi:hypothetical protein EYE40_11845 [Glaciihabitans arcticus]|uniref:Uncharacterized protein n=1 Tax=Glaciihabitans arcticus TaxID=2668039 RepID=A0A4Q9GWQ9_9MICO|nr:hypothetical protein [Glaciihabitans arcticus]TBN58028.1 hypothetical protein EYE40_11845 [Glaciihabitans arcticus]
MTDRDSAVRGMLVQQVQSTRLVALPSRRRLLIGGSLAFILSGAIAGGAVSAIASGDRDPREYTLEAPVGVFEHRATDFYSETILRAGIGDASIDLGERPEGATEVTFEFQCTAPGTFEWGLDAVTKGATYRCDADQFVDGKATGSLRYVFRDVTAGRHTIKIEAFESATWSLTATWAKQRPIEWGTNDRGQSYGIPKPDGTVPDLVAATGLSPSGDRVDGYLLGTEQTAAAEQFNEDEIPVDLPLYASDGETVVGAVRVGG